MPRSYNLGRRAAPKAEVRARILAAARTIYLEQGLRAASNLAIARAADVAPATVRNHFPDPAELTRAVLEAAFEELRIPTAAMFDGADDLGSRLTRLASALAAFYERSGPWWRAYEREPELIQAWAGGAERFYAEIDRLMRTALGDLAADEEALAVVASVIGPPVFFALRARGLAAQDAVRLTVDLALPWLERRRSERPPAP